MVHREPRHRFQPFPEQGDTYLATFPSPRSVSQLPGAASRQAMTWKRTGLYLCRTRQWPGDMRIVLPSPNTSTHSPIAGLDIVPPHPTVCTGPLQATYVWFELTSSNCVPSPMTWSVGRDGSGRLLVEICGDLAHPNDPDSTRTVTATAATDLTEQPMLCEYSSKLLLHRCSMCIISESLSYCSCISSTGALCSLPISWLYWNWRTT